MSVADDAATEFCEPWDSLGWERLLRVGGLPETDILGEDEDDNRRRNGATPQVRYSQTGIESLGCTNLILMVKIELQKYRVIIN